jgi:hypothetical protein
LLANFSAREGSSRPTVLAISVKCLILRHFFYLATRHSS